MNHFITVDNTLSPASVYAANKRVRLGLCCINNTLRKQNIYVNRTCIRNTFTVQKALDLSLQNVSDLATILIWNQQHDIKHYRMSSDMFPHFTDPETTKYSLSDEIIQQLKQAGQIANQYNHRITMHPGQHCVVGTPRRDVFEKTVEDLQMHAMILDQMNISPSEGILCVHGGGVYDDKETTIRRWIDQFDELPTSIKRRLAIENCEKSYNVEDCLYIAEACNIPMIYDSHHYYCNQYLHPEQTIPHIEELLPFIIDTWTKRGSNPLFHISDQHETKGHIGAHHDYIKEIPAHLMNIPLLYDVNIDIEVEAKAKELAIFDLYYRYHQMYGFEFA
jgi:UV DNA damage endonuclease